MNKFSNDSQNLSLQSAAFQAAAVEAAAFDSFQAGRISEADYIHAMDATAIACEYAKSKGVSMRDLPAH